MSGGEPRRLRVRASCRTRARTSRLKKAETCGTVHELTVDPPPSPPARVPDPRRGRAAAAAAGLHGWLVVKAGPSALAEEAAVRERVPTGFDPDPGLHDLRCTSIRSGLKVRAQWGHGTRFCLYLRRTRGGASPWRNGVWRGRAVHTPWFPRCLARSEAATITNAATRARAVALRPAAARTVRTPRRWPHRAKGASPPSPEA